MMSVGIFYGAIDDFFFQERSILQGGEFDGFEIRTSSNVARPGPTCTAWSSPGTSA